MKLGFVSLPEALDLKAATLHAMQDPAAYPQPYLANKMALYVDGSARGTNAAWSVVAIEYDWRGFPSIMGALSGLIELNHSSPQWIGEAHPDNFSAEITASVAAHIERDAVHVHLVLLSAPQIGCCCPVVRPVVCPGRWLMPWSLRPHSTSLEWPGRLIGASGFGFWHWSWVHWFSPMSQSSWLWWYRLGLVAAIVFSTACPLQGSQPAGNSACLAAHYSSSCCWHPWGAMASHWFYSCYGKCACFVTRWRLVAPRISIFTCWAPWSTTAPARNCSGWAARVPTCWRALRHYTLQHLSFGRSDDSWCSSWWMWTLASQKPSIYACPRSLSVFCPIETCGLHGWPTTSCRPFTWSDYELFFRCSGRTMSQPAK